MKHRITLILLFSIFNLATFGQVTKYFIEEFPQNKFPNPMPFCVSYSHEEQVFFGAIYSTDTVDGELSDTYKTNENFERDENKLLPLNYVKTHLIPKETSLYKVDSNDTLLTQSEEEYLDAEFYAMHIVYTASTFYAVTYERIFTNSLTSSEKFLCTFSNSGKFISRIVIASFVYSGTGMSNSGARVPWFPLEEGCVNEDLTISVTSPVSGEKKYRIQPDGTIVVVR